MPRSPGTHPKASRRVRRNGRGYGYKWAKYSRGRLSQHSECVRCGDVAECTDHIIPVEGPADSLFWEPTNHQSLCWTCHNRKTVQEDGRKVDR